MRVVAVQMHATDDKAANLAQAERLIRRAVERERPDLVALPETFAFIGGDRAGREEAAETLPGGAAYELLSRLARHYGIWIHGGSLFERTEGGLYNTTVVFDREGREAARYRKIHLFDVTTPDGRSYRESSYLRPGSEVVAFTLEGVGVGLSICYDVRFGELYRELVARGAQLILVPAAFTLETGRDHWEVLLRARAIETQCYVVAPAQWGVYRAGGERRRNYGRTMVVGPWGQVLATVQDGIGYAVAELDFAYLEQVRTQLPVHRHRRLDG